MNNVSFEKSALSHLSSIRAGIQEFLQWWFGHLAFLVPARLSGILVKKHKPSVVFEYSQTSIKVFHSRKDACDYIGEIRFEDAESETKDTRINTWLQDSAANLQTILSIPENKVVRKEIILPRVAVDNLDNVLKYELDRHTPFKADQAYYDYVISNKTIAQELVSVTVYAVAKTFINKLLKTTKCVGIENPFIVVAADLQAADPMEGKAVIRMDHAEKIRSASTNKLNMILSGALCTLTVAALLVPVYKMEMTVNELRNQLTNARKEVEVINKTRNDINGYINTLKSLKQEKTSAGNVVDVVLELTALLPDDTWLEKFSMKDGQIAIQGQTASAPELIRLLESSDVFGKAKFESSVVQSQGGASERFSIVAEINRGNGNVN